tara:strand:- start:138 stop:578 length:441 start_codon:yes stop_codon:yes gene_type:complete
MENESKSTAPQQEVQNPFQRRRSEVEDIVKNTKTSSNVSVGVKPHESGYQIFLSANGIVCDIIHQPLAGGKDGKNRYCSDYEIFVESEEKSFSSFAASHLDGILTAIEYSIMFLDKDVAGIKSKVLPGVITSLERAGIENYVEKIE